MELSEHNWANTSETICPEMLILESICLLHVVLSEYPDNSHNVRKCNFYDVITLVIYSPSKALVARREGYPCARVTLASELKLAL